MKPPPRKRHTKTTLLITKLPTERFSMQSFRKRPEPPPKKKKKHLRKTKHTKKQTQKNLDSAESMVLK